MKDIVHTVTYPQPVEAVWKALTTRELLSQWLMENDFHPEVGRSFRLRARPMPGWDGVVDCKVLELVAQTRMVWSWQGTNMKRATYVTFELEPVAGGTRLTLRHAGFQGVGGLFLRLMHSSGWKGKFLRKQLAGLLSGMERRTM